MCGGLPGSVLPGSYFSITDGLADGLAVIRQELENPTAYNAQ